MTEYPDPTLIDSWPSALVAVVVVLTFGVGPALFAYLTNKLGHEVRDEARAIKATLTERNGGESVKDHLIELREGLRKMDKRLSHLEDREAARHGKRWS